LDVSWDGAGAIDAVFEVAETNMTDRRIFLHLTGAALTQPALEWLLALAHPATDVLATVGRRVHDAHVDSIEEITTQLRRMDDQFGGGAVLDLVKSQIRFVVGLLRDRRYTTTVGMRLHGAAAELLRLAGWASFEAGQHGAAQRFWIAALHGAHSAGDRALGANILAFMSIQARDLSLFGEAVHLAEAAKRGYPGGSPRVSAILDLRVAQAYAQAGESKRCLAAIDAGYGSLRDMNDDAGGPAWSYWLDEADANACAGHCYIGLGDWPRAQDHLSTAIRLQDDSYRRDGALRRAWLALTYTHQGEPEQACGVAHEAVDILAEDVDSDRCIDHIRRVRDALAPYRTVAAVRDFDDRTQQLLKG
jgi:hypothetical protein